MFHAPEQYRCKPCLYGSNAKSGNNGTFVLPGIIGRQIFIVCSDWSQVALFSDDQLRRQGLDPALRTNGWEHVSASARFGRDYKDPSIPTWAEMCYVKDLFWDDEDVVVQFHPRKSEYVNEQPHTLHLWRPIHVELPVPPTILVGTQAIGGK